MGGKERWKSREDGYWRLAGWEGADMFFPYPWLFISNGLFDRKNT